MIGADLILAAIAEAAASPTDAGRWLRLLAYLQRAGVIDADTVAAYTVDEWSGNKAESAAWMDDYIARERAAYYRRAAGAA